MSWSVNAVGKPEAVATSIERQFVVASPCSEPEEAVRQAARGVIAGALAAQKPDSIIKVDASGSMGRDSWPDGPVFNTLNIKVEPLFGYVS